VLTAAGLGAIAIVAGTLAMIHLREAPPRAERVEFGVLPPNDLGIAVGFAVSPDGRHIVYATLPLASDRPMSVRSLASQSSRTLPGTEGGTQPFWSPDGRAIGFFANGKLRKIDFNGATSTPLGDTGAPPGGGTWNGNNVIVFAPTPTSLLYTVDAAGGVCTPLTTLATGEVRHMAPWFLPDGRHVLYLAAGVETSSLRVTTLEGASSTVMPRAESSAIYAAGQLLFARAGTLVAQGLDPDTLKPSGEPYVVSPEVAVGNNRVAVAASSAGVLAYMRRASQPTLRLTWFDRNGAALGPVGEAGIWANVNLSPDEHRLVVSRTNGLPPNRDIWIIDQTRADLPSRRTFNTAIEADPAFSPRAI
jgi:hypothetical protein